VRQLKSCVGRLSITKKQASRLGVPPYKRLSPLLEICCLLLSANESYQNAEVDIETLTGVKVGHSTQHRRVQGHEWSLPDAKQAISEVSIDGGKVRLRSSKGQESYWRDYKAVRLQNLYNCRRKQAHNFCAYLLKHRHRLVNYRDFQQQQFSSIGSGAVESAVKQIDRRLKISGAQWKLQNVSGILQLRCAYLNGLLAV
jgi:hypothetical protein